MVMVVVVVVVVVVVLLRPLPAVLTTDVDNGLEDGWSRCPAEAFVVADDDDDDDDDGGGTDAPAEKEPATFEEFDGVEPVALERYMVWNE